MPFVNKIMNWKINLNKFSWQPLIASAVRCAVAWIKKLKASLLISLIENGTKDERKAEILWIPQDHICHSAFWHLPMNGYVTCTYIIFSYTRKVGDQKRRKYEKKLFLMAALHKFVTHCVILKLFVRLRHASSIPYLFNNDNIAELCVSNMSEISPFTRNRISRDRKIWKFPVHWMKKCFPCTK